MEDPQVCACGHDDVTHALRLRRAGNVLGPVWAECLASVPGWECRCPEFAEPLSAGQILESQRRARAELEAQDAEAGRKS